MSVLAGAPLHSTVIAALRTAGKQVSHSVDTRDLLVALMWVDEPSHWSRIELHAGAVDAIAGKIAHDPVDRSSAEWRGIPLTGTCAAALGIAERLARYYDLWPLPAGILALGLIADESSAAAQALGDGLQRGELLRLIQNEVLGISLSRLGAVLPAIVQEATNPSRPLPFGWVPADARLCCGVCGSVPAVNVSLNGHQGFLLWIRLETVAGTFCRDCGLATYRSLTVKGLWLGWWSPVSPFFNAFVLLTNLQGRSTIARLPPPVPGAPRTPLDPGRPLHRRPSAIGGMLIPVIALIALATAIITSGDPEPEPEPRHAAIGTCFDQVPWVVTTVEMKEVPCSDASARTQVVAWFPRDIDGANECPKQGGNGYRKNDDGVLCLKTR
ncbi:hypothetical protein [Nocardia yamanashiensis]|uniref:hypothetical protein n=1 Tax=Nocardia yamanashiensis TaxID=209247 RepID=UPI0008368194|nr:hypothetical protein [Nocardia yamanashiensis]